MNYVLAGRSIGAVLGRSAGSADTLPAWAMAGGAPRPIACYQPKGAASLAASYVNLATPGTFNAAPGVAPTFASATGWTFDGSTQYLDTGIVPTTTTWSMIIRFSGWTSYGNAPVVAGAAITASSRFFTLTQYTDNKIYYGDGNFVGVTPSMSAGVIAVAGLTAYRNGSADGTIASTVAVQPPTIYVGARHDTAAPTVRQYAAASVQSIVIYSATLTSGQVAAVTAAMAAL